MRNRLKLLSMQMDTIIQQETATRNSITSEEKHQVCCAQ
jgi:hypothetical protein